MSQDDSGIIISTIPDPAPTSIPFVPSPGKALGSGGGVGTLINFASSQNATRSAIGDGLSYNAILITNAASVGASVCVIAAYYLLRRKHARLMKRTTLKLSLVMAMTDFVFHVSVGMCFAANGETDPRPLLSMQTANLAGYGHLPAGFGCAFVGGWLFAAPTILSLFYACAIALNTQLVFVHRRTPGDDKQKWFLGVPPIVTLMISAFTPAAWRPTRLLTDVFIAIPALAAGVYGFDPLLGYCWYAAEGVGPSRLLLRMIFTFDLWYVFSSTLKV
jgi:hypothetical protein